jgi:hypothetical protein
MKHNKKRNTAFIYETLIREFTRAIVEKNSSRKSSIINLLREHFVKGTPLADELELYSALLNTKNIQRPVAERILQETKGAYQNLNESIIFDAQSQLIKAINKDLGQDTWKAFVPNFKSLASVSTIFSSKGTVKKRVLFEQAIVDRMSAPHAGDAADAMRPIDNLTYNSFIKKFNVKYGVLLQEQKDLLNQYIASFADDGFELRVYLNEELRRLKESLASIERSTLAPLITTKMDNVEEYLEGFRRRDFNEADLSKVLKTQQLVQEFASHDQN